VDRKKSKINIFRKKGNQAPGAKLIKLDTTGRAKNKHTCSILPEK
jgi:hypothetical protein